MKIPLFLTLLLAITTTPGTFVAAAKKEKIDTSIYSNICGQSFPPLAPRGHKIVAKLIPLAGRTSLKTATTAQHAALCWIIHTDPQKTAAGNRHMLQRYALAVLYAATQGDASWTKKTNWLSVKSECAWFGVKCDVRGRVTRLEMAFNNMVGLLPRDIKLLADLEVLDLKANELQGVIPNGIGEMKKLKVLKLHMNGFFGAIPKEIGDLKNLVELNLYGNYLMGKLPTTIGKLKNLEILDLYANNIGGTVPTEMGKLTSLREAYFNDNNFEGTICQYRVKNLKRLHELWADCKGRKPEIKCEYCTTCCNDNDSPKCEKVTKTAKKVK